MKLTGELKTKVESAAGMEEKKAILAEAGMELTDEELAAVAGGAISSNEKIVIVNKQTPVFWIPYNPRSKQEKNLTPGTSVTIIDGLETEGGFAMRDYSPLIFINSPVKGWIPKSAIE